MRKKIDLRDAMNCVALMRERKMVNHEKYRIGFVSADSPLALGTIVRSGMVVLFREEEDGQSVTVERPMTAVEIARQAEKGSLLLTVGTTIGVPSSYITEIIVPREGGGE